MLPTLLAVSSFTPPPSVPAAPESVLGARLVYNSVAPSVSSTQISANTKGSGGAISAEDGSALLSVNSGAPQLSDVAGVSGTTASLSSAFLAQMLSQDDTTGHTQVLLVQYEKMLNLSNVKYKPSNAFKPSSGPANSFGQIVHPQRAQVQVPVVVHHEEPVQQAPQPEPQKTAIPAPVPVEVRTPQPVSLDVPVPVKTPAPAAAQAYKSVAKRNDAFAAKAA